jgi:outer membrane protein assembly factor BamB
LFSSSLAMLACHEPTDPAGRVVQVRIEYTELANLPGRTVQLGAVALNAQSSEVAGRSFAWGSSDTLAARVDATGLVLFGVRTGPARVWAREAGSGLADTVEVRSAQEGEVRWAVQLGYPLPELTGPVLGPDGRVYVLARASPDGAPQVDGELFRIGPAGRVECQVRLPQTHGNYAIPADDGETLLLAGMTSYALDAGTCSILASLPNPLAQSSLFTSAALGWDGALYASPHTGLVAFRGFPNDTMWVGPQTYGWTVPPTLVGSRLYAKRSGDSLYALEAATGRVIWQVPDPNDSSVAPYSWGSGPVVVGDRIYMPARFRLAAYDTSGAFLWKTPWSGTGATEPAVAGDGTLFVQFQQELVALRPDGVELWRRIEGTPVWAGFHGGPALAEGNVIYAAALGGFYAFAGAAGTLLWKTEPVPGDTSSGFVGAPAIGPDGTVYTFTRSHVYALFGSRRPAPDSPWPMWRRDARRTGRVP